MLRTFLVFGRWPAMFSLLGAFATTACHEPETHAGATRAAISDAPLVAPGGDPAVVCVFIVSLWGCASGSLVGPNVILTAAHNTRFRGGGDRPVSDMWVYFGNDAWSDSNPAHWTQVTEYVRHPDNDVALMRLSEPRSEPPLRISDASIEGRLGETMRVVGFGISDEDAVDAYFKREASFPVTEIPTEIVQYTDVDWPPGWEFYMEPVGETRTLPGDSGSPVFETTATGEEQIIGVIWGRDLQTGTNKATRIDKVYPWLCEELARLEPACADGSCCEAEASCIEDSICDATCSDDPDCAETDAAVQDAMPIADAGAVADAGAPDAASPTPAPTPQPPRGGCSAAPSTSGTWLGALTLSLLVWSRRRKR